MIGAWELVSYRAHSTKNPEEFICPMGEEVRGILMLTPDGYMGAQIQEPGAKNVKSGDLNGGTDEELAERARHYFGYTGPATIDESGPEPILKSVLQLSAFPNWLGSTQTRIVKLEGDKLTLRPEGPIEIFVSLP